MKPELLNANAIASALQTSYWRVSVVDEIDSTQNYLRTSNPKSGELIAAEYQSAGRGRLDRKFDAEKSSALLFSFYFEPETLIKNFGYLTLLVGASVAATLNEITESNNFNCKWPNDILFNGRKVAGILAEKNNAGVIVGIGINVSTSEAALPVAHATSIFLATKLILDRNILLAVVWTGALIGVALRVFWVGAPRWLYVANYLLLGWVAIIYTPQLYEEGGLWVLLPILIGGLLYSIGAIFYALKLPGRNAKYFGFHELFHVFVLAAWISQYLAVSFAIYRK